MQYFKLQVGCLSVVLFIILNYFREIGIKNKKFKLSLFGAIVITAIIQLFFDGLTAYTVNNLETVKPILNLIFHLCFLISINTMVFLMYVYILDVTEKFPTKLWKKIFIFTPYIGTILAIFISINKLEYIHGKTTNYSMGIPVYACFTIVALYFILTFFTFIRHWKFVEQKKRMTILIYMIVSLCVMLFQAIFPEILITAIGPTIFVLGIYINHENPTIKRLTKHRHTTVMDFATLAENRDNSTGGHIKRTTAYVKLLSKELQKRKYYQDILTKDYLINLQMASPMHDIGKISTPDAILQKPGKLTDEEYSIMKEHSKNGAKIIEETFGKHDSPEFRKMAYEVALYHHEKWNGKGYPMGLKEDEIPLSARIMSIADVFDAVSQKRCYRDAMPLDECFEIIQKGKGWDFDPLLVDIFLSIRPQVEQIYKKIYG
ncbi:MAG: HD domain-containing protein [Treponema sp.]|nr:HD domain-containing protein [Treponema sp.]